MSGPVAVMAAPSGSIVTPASPLLHGMDASALPDAAVAPSLAPSSASSDAPHPPHEASESVRLAVIGNVDSGKSTLVGVLSRNIIDDGRGKARAHVFHHKHELETGRSSAVTVEIMGFDGEKPLPVDLKASRQRIWQNVHSHADKSITFIDLCGHEKYLKTTIFGLTGYLPDYGLVIVGANMGVSRMTKEHIGISAALGLPLIIVITKIDLAPADVYKHTMDTMAKILKQARKMPYVVRSMENVATAAAAIVADRITPIVCVSNVTGEGLDLLRALLRQVPARVSSLAARGEAFTLRVPVGNGLGPASSSTAAAATEADSALPPPAPAVPPASAAAAVDADGAPVSDTPGEATVDSVFNVPGVGAVVAGTVMRGCIRVGSSMLLGPDRFGDFQAVVVRSIHVQYTPVDVALPGGSAAFAVRPKGKAKTGPGKKNWMRKGMSLVDPRICPVSYWEFEAEILVLHHQTTLSVGYAPIMHCGVISQSARVTGMTDLTGAPLPALRTGDRAIITCRFMYRPEYIHAGDMLLFREGRAKGVGRVRTVQCPNHVLASLAAVGAGGEKE